MATINPFPNKPWFLRVCRIGFLKTLQEKEKLLVMRNFSFSQCFLPLSKTFCHFHQNSNCRLQTLSVWKSLKFVVWERVKTVSLPQKMLCFVTGSISLKESDKGSPKEHSCEIWLKSSEHFQSRNFFRDVITCHKEKMSPTHKTHVFQRNNPLPNKPCLYLSAVQVF